MSAAGPEEHFRRGRAALERGRPGEAAAHFNLAVNREKEMRILRPQMRYISFYGLSLALAYGPTHEALAMCEMAAREDPTDPEVHCNLGRVCLMARKTTRALAAFEWAIRLDPEDLRPRRLRDRADRRSRPILPWLGRDHPINWTTGRLRTALSRRKEGRR